MTNSTHLALINRAKRNGRAGMGGYSAGKAGPKPFRPAPSKAALREQAAAAIAEYTGAITRAPSRRRMRS